MQMQEIESVIMEKLAETRAEQYAERDPYLSPEQRLAHAIILQAVREYRLALRRLRVRPDAGSARRSRAELEEFFFSPLFAGLTGLDPRYLVNRLLREAGMESRGAGAAPLAGKEWKQ